MNILHGSCHCGAVRYESRGKVLRFVNCHCPDCRKNSGSAFGAVLVVESDGFHVVSGEADLVPYESSPQKFRSFCRHCGSPVFSRSEKNPAITMIRAGTLDDDPGIKPQMHIWVSAKAPWHDICDDLPQHPEGPPRK